MPSKAALIARHVLSTHSLSAIIANKKMEQLRGSRMKQLNDFQDKLEEMKVTFMELYKNGCKSKRKGSVDDYKLTHLLGKGSFSSVVLCKHKASKICYAMKIMNKGLLIKKDQYHHVTSEKQILIANSFPFLIHMEFYFKDNCNIFFVLPFSVGGDLFTHMDNIKFFKEKDVQFYVAQVILAIEYLHYMDVIYRDLKPENIVIEADGYLKLTDFGFSKIVKTRTYTLCGTPEYLAPEIILSTGYGKSVDWWAIGIFIYEMIAGYTPFHDEDHLQIYENITSGKVSYTDRFTRGSRDLIGNILQKDITRRYGNLKNGVFDIKNHEWFQLVDWDLIYNKKVAAPFMPYTDVDDFSKYEKFNRSSLETSSTEKYVEEYKDF